MARDRIKAVDSVAAVAAIGAALAYGLLADSQVLAPQFNICSMS